VYLGFGIALSSTRDPRFGLGGFRVRGISILLMSEYCRPMVDVPLV